MGLSEGFDGNMARVIQALRLCRYSRRRMWTARSMIRRLWLGRYNDRAMLGGYEVFE